MIDQISNQDPQSTARKIEEDEGSNLFYLDSDLFTIDTDPNGG